MSKFCYTKEEAACSKSDGRYGTPQVSIRENEKSSHFDTIHTRLDRFNIIYLNSKLREICPFIKISLKLIEILIWEVKHKNLWNFVPPQLVRNCEEVFSVRSTLNNAVTPLSCNRKKYLITITKFTFRKEQEQHSVDRRLTSPSPGKWWSSARWSRPMENWGAGTANRKEFSSGSSSTFTIVFLIRWDNNGATQQLDITHFCNIKQEECFSDVDSI